MKFRSIFLLFLIAFALSAGCSKKKRIIGNEYIPQEVLVDVLVDIHLIDGITSDRKYYRKYTFNDSIVLLEPIFEKHNVSRAEFDSTMMEYSRHPELLDKVYDEVIMKLNLMLDELDKKQEEEKKDNENENSPEDLKEPINKNQKRSIIRTDAPKPVQNPPNNSKEE